MSEQKLLKISVITVCRNSGNTLERTIQSVLTQNYSDIEYIVVDGCSTDNTSAILERYRDAVDVVISEKDSGLYDAMNKGISLATGDIVGFLNADDVFESEYSLNKLIVPFAKPDIDAVFADLVYVNIRDKVVRYWQSRSFRTGDFGKGWAPAHPTFYARREVYLQHGGFNCSVRFGNDIEMMMRLMEKHHIKTFYIPKVVVRMLVGGVSNGSFKTIWIQNQTTIQIARSYGICCKTWEYTSRKLWSRLWQFIARPKWNRL